MDGWLIWLVAAIAAGVGEIITMGFFLAPFGIGATAAMVVDLLGGGLAVSIVVFFAVTGAAFGGLRPVVRRHTRMPVVARTGTAALIGRNAVVLERVDRDAGSVKLDGEVWSARAYDDDEVMEPGARVQVVEIRGATAMVTQ